MNDNQKNIHTTKTNTVKILKAFMSLMARI